MEEPLLEFASVSL
jgi:hypothetical protein